MEQLWKAPAHHITVRLSVNLTPKPVVALDHSIAACVLPGVNAERMS